MPPDPLQRLLTLRSWAVEQARATLGTALKAEAEAHALVALVDADARREQEAAGTQADCEGWLGGLIAASRNRTRERRKAAQAALADAGVRVAECRALFAAARSDRETVEALMRDREIQRAALAEQRAQHALDDVVRNRFPQL